jgi:hypothetical protein
MLWQSPNHLDYRAGNRKVIPEPAAETTRTGVRTNAEPTARAPYLAQDGRKHPLALFDLIPLPGGALKGLRCNLLCNLCRTGLPLNPLVLLVPPGEFESPTS